MPTLEFEGKSYEVDEEGYLQDWQIWNEGLANEMAKQDGLDLTEAHWDVIRFLRTYFEKYQIAPMIKILTKEIGKKMGPEKGNTKYLYELYPAGPAKQACRYAGLPKPTGCV
ncbi:MAG: TusE/DsrC/DsvC family sulfur relay protein [Thermodesulfovibrionia bacterium]|nr:TusE/DsrC/DsvC family sulfur relay protein [Thermodesulfovibrionia bacterium]MCK5511467.1 TusE/DsrC/DsvC family sulfur relay protein [Thermodesulfovibrionia bacterium]